MTSGGLVGGAGCKAAHAGEQLDSAQNGRELQRCIWTVIASATSRGCQPAPTQMAGTDYLPKPASQGTGGGVGRSAQLLLVAR